MSTVSDLRSDLSESLREKLTPYEIQRGLIDETNSEIIGNGAYGKISKVKYCGTPCALKELHSFLLPEFETELRNNSSVVKFCSEIKLLSEIRHPNFVHFIGVYFREKSPFPVLIMELMHTSVAHCLEKYEEDKQKFPLSTKLFILQDVARALCYLHSQKPAIIHRDLTANNVLLTSDMKAKLADLGVAKIIDPNLAKLSTTQCPGTLAYMPPEALKEHPTYNTEIDVYSFGVLGFHIFSSKWPLYHGALNKDNSRLSDTQRCHADLIGEGFCLAKTFENCMNANPKQRVTAPIILEEIDKVIMNFKIQKSNFLEAQYSMTYNAVMLDEMHEVITSQSDILTSKEQDISKLENTVKEHELEIECLKSHNESLKSTVKLAEENNTKLVLELETVRKILAALEETIEQSLNVIDKDSALPCQHCFTLEKDKKVLLDCIISLNEKISILSNEIEAKNQEIINMKEQVHIKKKEVELKEGEIKNLSKEIKLWEAKVDFKSKGSIDIVSSPSSQRLSERNTELLENIEKLSKKHVEMSNRLKIGQDHYRKIIQDLLFPHKGIVCPGSPCMEFNLEIVSDVKLNPTDQFVSLVQNITIPSGSITDKMVPTILHDDKIIFLCNVYLKKSKKLCIGVAVCFDQKSGEFNMVGNPEAELVTIGHFGSKVLAVKTNKQFCFLDDFTWKETSIPPLPIDCFYHPVMLTYQSFLLIIDGSTVFVNDDGVGKWMQFDLLTPDGRLDSSPKNSVVVMGGKLFVCNSAKEMVYCLELQQIIHLLLNDSATYEKDKSTVSKQVLQLRHILRGANFIALHGNNVIAVHTTSATRVSSVYIDKIRYYDIYCCHWHEVEYSSNNQTIDVVNGYWLSLQGDCAGVCAVPSVPKLGSWQSWGRAKLFKVQYRDNNKVLA